MAGPLESRVMGMMGLTPENVQNPEVNKLMHDLLQAHRGPQNGLFFYPPNNANDLQQRLRSTDEAGDIKKKLIQTVIGHYLGSKIPMMDTPESNQLLQQRRASYAIPDAGHQIPPQSQQMVDLIDNLMQKRKQIEYMRQNLGSMVQDPTQGIPSVTSRMVP